MLSSIFLRGQIGAIRLAEDAIQRHFFRNGPQLVALGVRQRAGKGNIKTEGKRALCIRPITRKTVNNPAALLRMGFFQQRHRLGIRIPRSAIRCIAQMDEKRFSGPFRPLNLFGKDALLHIARGVIVVIVQPAFANRANFGIFRKIHQFLGDAARNRLGFVRVHPGGGKNLDSGTLPRHFQRFKAGMFIASRNKNAPHSCVRSSG